MRRLEARRTIDAAPAAVWQLLVDTTRWPDWGPTVRAVDYPARWLAAGATGRVQTVGRIWLPFRVTEFEAERAWSWSVAGIPATGHHVSPSGDGGSEVRFTVPVVAAPYLFVVRRGLDNIARLAGR